MQPFAPHDFNATPAKVDVAFRALAYCRSLTDPLSVGIPSGPSGSTTRPLSDLERGVESAALNLLRNYLNDEIELGPIAELHRAGSVPTSHDPSSHCPFQISFPEDDDNEVAA